MLLEPGPAASIDPAGAWKEYRPSGKAPWDLERASHLFRRAGFSANRIELERAIQEGPKKTVERLMNGEDSDADFYDRTRGTVRALVQTEQGLPAWWLHVMRTSPHPLLEKITLFWHGHFATSSTKVTDGRMMLRQNEILRKNALGKFQPLLADISKDPAMLIWLDSTSNKKIKPNENFAREVMELFCLGLDNYTEKDIKEAARSFTGWEVRHGKFYVNAYEHDKGEKNVLGQRGNWDGDDVIRILLDQAATARFIAGKMYRYLVSETAQPSDEVLEALAAGYRQSGYDASVLVRTIISSNLFFSEHALHQKVKAPVELGIGLLRGLEGSTNMYALADELKTLGQAVFAPPNVKGWDGGTEWINSATLLTRVNLAWAMVSGRGGQFKKTIDLEQLAKKYDQQDPAEAAKWLADLLLGTPLPQPVYNQLAATAGGMGDLHIRLARVVEAIAALPEFHLA